MNQRLELPSGTECGAIVAGHESADMLDKRMLARVCGLERILSDEDEDLIGSAGARPVEFELGRGFFRACLALIGREAVGWAKDQEKKIALLRHALAQRVWRGNVGELL